MNEKRVHELTCANPCFLCIILGEAASYDEPLRVRGSPRCSFCRASNGLRVHEAINIITERERVGIIIADDRKKRLSKEGRRGTRKRGKERDGREEEDSEKEEVVWWWYILK